MEKLYSLIADLGDKYNAEKILLFGSRAIRSYKAHSNIALAIKGLTEEHQVRI
mgnify:CR=1 FL=1